MANNAQAPLGSEENPHLIRFGVKDGEVEVAPPEVLWKGVFPGDFVSFVSDFGEVHVTFTGAGQLPFVDPTIIGDKAHQILNLADPWSGICKIKKPDGTFINAAPGNGPTSCPTCPPTK